ncbi:MAG: hypothetical protein JOZ48_00155 [Acidobacteriaceae bacterium]|nr:hypothetical protein [Acidobacteriaceae bacterium]
MEVIYKGSVIHLNPGPTPPGKLARAKRQHALLVDPDAIIGSDPDLLSTMEAEAQEDWKAL